MQVAAAKLEMTTAERLAAVYPRRFGVAAAVYAQMLYCRSRYGEAEDCMRHVSVVWV